MVTKEQKTKKYCCLYASDFHLEMILLPYIKKHLKNSEFIILTQIDLTESIKVLLEKTNLSEMEKKDILKLNWGSKNKIENKLSILKKDINFIINGDLDYINKATEKIKKLNLTSKIIIDCYHVDTIKNMPYLEENYDCILNTKNL